MPPGRAAKTALAKHDELASALRPKPVARDRLILAEGDHPGEVIVTVTSGIKAEPRGHAVLTAEITDWRQPILLGDDPRGRPVHYTTAGTHSLIVGCTGSGKTSLTRKIAAHAVKDPSSTVFLIDGKGDADDWRPLHPLCANTATWVDGSSALPQILAVLDQVTALSDSRANMPRGTAPPVLLVADEWFAICAAADGPTRKRLEATMGMLLAKSRSRGVHIVIAVQRATKTFLSTDLRVNIRQRLAGTLEDPAETSYVIGQPPATLPARPGEFLAHYNGDLHLVATEEFTDRHFRRVCADAAALRARLRPAPAPAAAPAPGDVDQPADAGVGGAAAADAGFGSGVPSGTPGPEDPWRTETLRILHDGNPAGMSTAEIHAALPEPLRPKATAMAFGRDLTAWAAEPDPGIRRVARGKSQAWRPVRTPAGTAGSPAGTPATPAETPAGPR